MEINVSGSQKCDILQPILMVVKKKYPAFDVEKSTFLKGENLTCLPVIEGN